MRCQHLRDLRICCDIADEREIGITRGDARIRDGLGGHWSGECRHSEERNHEEQDDKGRTL